MSTAFGMKSNCIAEGENEYRYWGRKFFEVNIFWNAMFMFTPQFYDFFSIPYTDPGVAKFFTKLFRDNMEYRKMNNIVRYDFMNLLVEIMNNGYVAPDRNKATADALGKYIAFILTLQYFRKYHTYFRKYILGYIYCEIE